LVFRDRKKISALLIFIAVAVPCFFWLRIAFRSRLPEAGGTVLLHYGLRSDKMDWDLLPSLPPQKPYLPEPIAESSPAVQTALPSPVIGESLPSGVPNLLSVRQFPVLEIQIGVVDVDRLLIVHPPISSSPEGRTNAISEILRETAVCAAAHDCTVVLNSSGNTLDGVAFVLYAAQRTDLTEEVARRLNP
jgi:hypothetical protein